MRTGSMCFSILQVPRCRIPTLATFWRESFHSLSRTDKNSSSFRPLGSNIYGLERGYNRKWTRRPVFTNAEGRNKTTQQSKPSNIGHEILDGLVSKSDTFSVNKTEISQFQNIEYCDIRQKIAENKELASLVTVIVFDIEATGFSRENERIIEIALRDLEGGENSTFQTLVNPQRFVPNSHVHGITTRMVNKPDVPRENERIIEIALRDLEGGENSTFQTLVNPQRFVPNSHVHGITTRMVNKPDIPRMEDLIPILLQFVRSRQKPGVLAAHNARSFDVPFLRSEFTRCKAEFPSNWLFVDMLTLTRVSCTSLNSCSSSLALFTVTPTSHTDCLSLNLLRLVHMHQATIEKSTAVLEDNSENMKVTKSPKHLNVLVRGW
nr:exonuclease dpd1, chloroplastic/mitochondrial [Quercus suber]